MRSAATGTANYTELAARPVSGIYELAVILAKARFQAKEGDGRLFISAIIAFTICHALALTVAGGTWMFYQRMVNPTGQLAEIMADSEMAAIGIFYFALAIVACTLLVPSMASLASGAAVLGARGRERRLAALRLIGLSAFDITKMSLLETTLQALIGALCGTVCYFVTLPLWSLMSFMNQPIAISEMIVPWWLLSMVLIAVIVIAVLSSAWGLQRVRITPLGVARKATPPALKWWRLIAFGVVFMILLGFPVISQFLFNISATAGLFIFVLILLLAYLAVSMVGPWVLQLLSRMLAHLAPPSVMWAARRVQFEPRQVWRRVTGLAGLAFIGGFLSGTPLYSEGGTGDPVNEAMLRDLPNGAHITLVIGLILTATSIFIGQTSEVLERAEQSIALARMGAPRSFIFATSWWQVLGPVTTSVALGGGMGFMGSGAIQATTGIVTGGLFWLVIGVGMLIIVAAMLAVAPVQAQILDRQIRRND